MARDHQVLSRRAFLGLAASSGAGLMTGCSVTPGSRWWGPVSLAETLGEFFSRPVAGARVKEYPRSAISSEFPVRSLMLPGDYAQQLADWMLQVDGLIDGPKSYTPTALKTAFVKTVSITRHDCVEGWSAIAEWGGIRLSDFLAVSRPHPEARYVIFHSADFDEDSHAPFYGSLTLAQAAHPQLLLAYEMNGASLPMEHGAPLRLRVPNQLGYKSTKFIHRISLVASMEGIGKGKGGYWEDAGYEHWAGI
jgi:DMSO/TMAO reductase YedYZ molybdopterin-dependent catalytic subunit